MSVLEVLDKCATLLHAEADGQGRISDPAGGAALFVESALLLSEARAVIADLIAATQALGVMPDGYCFCSRHRFGGDKHHEPECADLRAVLASCQEHQDAR